MKVSKVVVGFTILTVFEIFGLIYTKFFVVSANIGKPTGVLLFASIIGTIFSLSRAIFMTYRTYKLIKTGEPSLDFMILCVTIITSALIRAI